MCPGLRLVVLGFQSPGKSCCQIYLPNLLTKTTLLSRLPHTTGMLNSEDTKQEKVESMAVAVDMPPASSTPEAEKAQEPFLSRLNNFLHSNIYVYLITYYLYWLGFWLFMPMAGFFTMLGFGLYDLFTVKGFRKPCGPVLITGTSSGFGLDLTLQLAAQGWKVRVVLMYVDKTKGIV